MASVWYEEKKLLAGYPLKGEGYTKQIWAVDPNQLAPGSGCHLFLGLPKSRASNFVLSFKVPKSPPTLPTQSPITCSKRLCSFNCSSLAFCSAFLSLALSSSLNFSCFTWSFSSSFNLVRAKIENSCIEEDSARSKCQVINVLLVGKQVATDSSIFSITGLLGFETLHGGST